MKILAAGDLHGDSSLASRLAEQAESEKTDLVIICGDLTNFDQLTNNVISLFLDKGRKVVFVPGNHDSFATADFMTEFYGITNLHGYSIDAGDIGFFGCGGANIGLHQLSESDIFSLLEQGFEKVKDKKIKIMVTHVHPDGTKMDKLSNIFPGSKGVHKAIKELNPWDFKLYQLLVNNY